MLAAGTGAHAQTGGSITDIVGSASTTVTLPGFAPFDFGANKPPLANPNALPVNSVVTGTGASGASYNSFVNIGASSITFESANAGALANSSSTSSVSFRVNDSNPDFEKPKAFASTITAAGLGFYLADTSGGCLYSCPQATGKTFNDLGFGNTDVGFTFSVMSGASDSPLYTLSGSLNLFTGDGVHLTDGLGVARGSCDFDVCPGTGPRGLLGNFRTTLGDDYDGIPADIGLASAVGYAWDATDISFLLPASEAQTLTYSTTVTSNAAPICIGNTMICLVAYSAFGDPVGRGGGVENLTAGDLRSLGSFSRIGGPEITGSGRIGGLQFGPTTFALPTFDGVSGSFQTDAGVPEPATWITLILGFGLLGATLRRRRTVAAI